MHVSTTLVVIAQFFSFLIDDTFPSLGIQTKGGIMEVIIPRNAVGPVKVDRIFSTYFDLQQSILIQIFEGERPKAKYNNIWGRVAVDIAPAPKGVAKVSVSFYIDTSNLLRVTVHYEEQQYVLCGPRTKLSDERIALMFHQVATYALDDERWKMAMEAKLSLIYKTTQILRILCDEYSEGSVSSELSSEIAGLLDYYEMNFFEDAEFYLLAMRKMEGKLERLDNETRERVKHVLLW